MYTYHPTRLRVYTATDCNGLTNYPLTYEYLRQKTIANIMKELSVMLKVNMKECYIVIKICIQKCRFTFLNKLSPPYKYMSEEG